MPSRTTERPSRSKEPSRISARVKRSATADLYQRYPGPALTRPGSQVWGFPANTYAAHSIAADAHSARSAHKGDISEYLRNLGDRLSSLYSEYPERGAIDRRRRCPQRCRTSTSRKRNRLRSTSSYRVRKAVPFRRRNSKARSNRCLRPSQLAQLRSEHHATIITVVSRAVRVRRATVPRVQPATKTRSASRYQRRRHRRPPNRSVTWLQAIGRSHNSATRPKPSDGPITGIAEASMTWRPFCLSS